MKSAYQETDMLTYSEPKKVRMLFQAVVRHSCIATKLPTPVLQVNRSWSKFVDTLSVGENE